MEIKVSVEDTGKLVRLEVNESHTVGEVVEQILEGLDLPRDRAYILTIGNLRYGPDRSSLTVADLGPQVSALQPRRLYEIYPLQA